MSPWKMTPPKCERDDLTMIIAFLYGFLRGKSVCLVSHSRRSGVPVLSKKVMHTAFAAAAVYGCHFHS